MYQLVVTYKKNKCKSNFDDEIHNYIIKNGLKVYDENTQIVSRHTNETNNVIRYVAVKDEDLKNQSYYFEIFFKMNNLWKDQKWKRHNESFDYTGDGWFCGNLEEKEITPRPITEYISARLEFIDTSRTINLDNLI